MTCVYNNHSQYIDHAAGIGVIAVHSGSGHCDGAGVTTAAGLACRSSRALSQESV